MLSSGNVRAPFHCDLWLVYVPLQEMLVHLSNRLCIRTLEMARGKMNRRTTAFVKACVAYSQVTIPSILDTMKQIKLYLVAAQVALQNALPQQAEVRGCCFESGFVQTNSHGRTRHAESLEPRVRLSRTC